MRSLYALIYVAVLVAGWFYPVVALGAFGFMGAVILVLFIMAFSAQLYLSGILVSFSWIVLGRIFYRMCLVIVLPFAMAINQRIWCSFCSVGNLLRK